MDVLVLRGRGFERFAAAPANGDARAGSRQGKRDRGADTAAASGDQRVFAGQTHGITAVVTGSVLAASRYN
jgi:hypothetical protein